MKPLYAIPICEIKQVQVNENQKRKTYSIEIEMKECYGIIGSKIGQLVTGCIFMGQQ